MEYKPNIQPKRQRVRLNPTRKWSLNEEKALIEFLLDNIDVFEIPTAQTFYKRFSNEKKVDIEWRLVRSKVKNMRMNYAKAKNLSETSVLEGNIEMSNTALKKCNYFMELDMIFSNQNTEPIVYEESLESKDNSFLTNRTMSTDGAIVLSEKSNGDILLSSSNRNGIINLPPKIDSVYSMKESLEKNQQSGIDIRERELTIKERELTLRERRLQLKERKVDSQEKIKILKINSREKIKILKIEMQERLALEELKLKYKQV